MPLRPPVSPLSVAFDGARAVIQVSDGHFDNAADPSPGEQLYRFVEELGPCEVALDFANILFLSSIGLTVLLSLNKQLRAAGGRLTIFNVQPAVRDIFAVTHLDSVLDVHPKQRGAPA